MNVNELLADSPMSSNIVLQLQLILKIWNTSMLKARKFSWAVLEETQSLSFPENKTYCFVIKECELCITYSNAGIIVIRRDVSCTVFDMTCLFYSRVSYMQNTTHKCRYWKFTMRNNLRSRKTNLTLSNALVISLRKCISHMVRPIDLKVCRLYD